MKDNAKRDINLPPHHEEAEQAILGAILLNNGIVDDLVPTLRPEDFYRESHGAIYRAMVGLHEQGRALDLISLSEALKRDGALNKAGGMEYLMSLVDVIATSSGSSYHAELVKDASTRRRLMLACQTIFDKCANTVEESGSLLDLAEQAIFELATDRVGEGPSPLLHVLQDSYRLAEASCNGERGGLTTGFHDLDRQIGGLQPKELVILAARPGMGKTALAINMAQSACEQGHGVVIFSLEMSREQLGLRLLASVGRVDLYFMRNGRLRPEDLTALRRAADRIAHLPMFIDDSPDTNLLEMKAKVRRLQRRQPVGLVVVDYLQLIRSDHTRRNESREKEVAVISAGLKGMAKSFGVCVLALSQLNRRVEARDNKEPELADLRESGSIEQDADAILFIYRPEAYGRTEQNRGKANVIVAKHRNGPTGTVPLTYITQYTRFENHIEKAE